jgi:hypothetical protein
MKLALKSLLLSIEGITQQARDLCLLMRCKIRNLKYMRIWVSAQVEGDLHRTSKLSRSLKHKRIWGSVY